MKRSKRRILYKDFINEWLEDKKNYVKESTYANYANIVHNHLIPQLGNYRISDITNKMLQNLILDKYRYGRLDKCGGLSDKTIRDIGSVIKLSFKSAIRDNLIDYINLDLYYPKNNVSNKIYIFNKEEQGKIVDYVVNNLNIKNVGILLTLYSGLRIGEVCALKWRDVNFKKNTLVINKTLQRIYIKEERSSKVIITNPKTSSGNREIPINAEFAKLLKKFKTNNDHYLLSSSNKWIEPRLYRRYYVTVLKRLNINILPFHSLRHTFASNCIRLGADYKTVSELLGHSSVNITLNIYVHPQIEQKKKCINAIYKDNTVVFNNEIDKKYDN